MSEQKNDKMRVRWNVVDYFRHELTETRSCILHDQTYTNSTETFWVEVPDGESLSNWEVEGEGVKSITVEDDPESDLQKMTIEWTDKYCGQGVAD